MTNSFKEWLLYEADGNMLGGLGQLVDKFKTGYERGAKHSDNMERVGKANVMRGLVKDAAKAKEDEDKTKDKSNQDSIGLRKDIDLYISNMFKNFPYDGGAGGPEDMMSKYESYASALEAFKIFKGYAEQIAKMRKAMNTTLVKQKKLTAEQLAQINKQATKIAQGGQLPKQLIDFTSKESSFFTRLFKLSKDDFGLDEQNFSTLLSSKMRSTSGDRINDAALALNMLFTYIELEFVSYYKYLADVGAKRKRE